jgi:hypothetical protein
MFFSSIAFAADNPDKVMEQVYTKAVTFNTWYLKKFSQQEDPIYQSHEIDKYVTVKTLKNLRNAYHQIDDGKSLRGYYDVDMFTKTQDIGDDWSGSVTVLKMTYDPACLNVYLAFGKDKKHVVVDCFVQENGIWKIQSVTDGNMTK